MCVRGNESVAIIKDVHTIYTTGVSFQWEQTCSYA